MNRLHAIFAAALFSALSCGTAGSGGEDLSALGFYSSPAAVISRLGKNPREAREHFMLGMAHKSEKRYKNAIYHFANSCFARHRSSSLRLFPQPVYQFVRGFHFKSDYYDDSVFEIGRLFSSYDEHAYAAKFADLVSKDSGILYRDAMLLKAGSHVALGENREALSVLEKTLGRYDDHDSAALINIRIGSLLARVGDPAGSLDAFLRVLKPDVRGWQASTAAKQILSIMKEKPRALTQEERLRYARALFHAKEYREALAVLESGPFTGDHRGVAAAYRVRALVREKQDGKAEAVVKDPENADFTAVLAKARADETWSSGRKNQALPLYEEIIRSGHEPQAQESLKRLGSFMEERRRSGFERYLVDYKNRYRDETAGHFLWLLGRSMIRGNNHDGALRYLEESLASHPRGRSSGPCRFWLHKLYAARGESGRAEEIARDLVVLNPDSSYTWRLITRLSADKKESVLADEYRKAIEEGQREHALYLHALLMTREQSLAKAGGRLGDLDSPDIARYRDMEKTITGLRTSSSHGGAIRRIDRYFAVGYLQGIYRELRPLLTGEESRKDRLIALAHYGARYNHAYLNAYSRIRLLDLLDLRENITLMPPESSRALFPAPFGECMKRWSEKFAVKRNMLYAVMKAESFFRHDAVSSAGAVGLMQIMPATARGLARALGIKDFSLADPCTSIRLGARYIADLKRQFGGNFPHMVAAYNAGPGNVRKWQERMAGEDMDYFTEFTPFFETRHYILRTGKFLVQYGIIHPGNEAPR
ncbi:MAG: transglycosylase SLT domain-containing protein [Spirochaetes bacterium]|nr:transglycosylase SLT domain-containing protein [Spirochaetota bacterium]